MFKFLKNFLIVIRLYNYLSVHSWFFNLLKELKLNSNLANGIILTQVVRNYDFILRIAIISKVITEKYNLNLRAYNSNISWKTKNNFKGRLLEYPFKFFLKNVFEKIYSSLVTKNAFDLDSKYKNQTIIKSELNKVISNIDFLDPGSVLKIKFENILVGDLIYDSYLRFFNKPTLKKINSDLIYVIEKSLNSYYISKDFINKNNVKILLTTYVTYIEHGLVTRLCLKKSIPVYTIASKDYVLQKVTNDFPCHVKDHSNYDPNKKLSNSQLVIAKSKLESRLKGFNDEAISYMKNSPFKNVKMDPVLKNNFNINKRNIVIYMHDFFDSPHVYRTLQFLDLYMFLKEILDEMEGIKSTSVFVKIHPNFTENVKETAIELIESYNANHFFIIDEKVSNINILELKPDLICTARGTVAIEMAYLNIPVLALYDNPYVNFNFAHTCYNKISFFEIIKGYKKPKIDFEKSKILSFYYQAYIEGVVENDFNAFRNIKKLNADPYLNEYLYLLKKMNYKLYINNSLEITRNFIKDKSLINY